MIPPFLIWIASGFLLGLISSGHCLGMCGPLSFWLSGKNKNSNPMNKTFFFLNAGLGKALAYSLLGFIFGYLGFLVAGFKITFIYLNIALMTLSGAIFIAVGGALFGWWPHWDNYFKKIENYLFNILRSNQSGEGASGDFLAGFFWGFLPCPMVLAPALAASVLGHSQRGGLDGALQGFFMMFGFGLGTLPALSLPFLFREKKLFKLPGGHIYSGAAYLIVGCIVIGYSLMHFFNFPRNIHCNGCLV